MWLHLSRGLSDWLGSFPERQLLMCSHPDTWSKAPSMSGQSFPVPFR